MNVAEGFDVRDSLSGLREAVIRGDAKAAKTFVQSAIDAQVDPQTVVREGLVPAMDVVGELFRSNEYYVPEVLIAARAMKAGMDLLRPLLAERGAVALGKVVIGTVRGDLHDIGKNLVSMMLEGAGFEVYDVGIDCDADTYIAKAKEVGAHMVAMSALLSTTMINMKEALERVESAGLRGSTKVIVGGAPVTQEWADQIGADGYAPDAASAVTLAKRLLGIQVEESTADAANRLFLEARDLFEVAIRRGTPGEIKAGINQARAKSAQAREHGADEASLERLSAAMDREEARFG